ncbi:MAG: hypothetical protein ACLFTL_06440 [Alphaproteobacteria bacterium]
MRLVDPRPEIAAPKLALGCTRARCVDDVEPHWQSVLADGEAVVDIAERKD